MDQKQTDDDSLTQSVMIDAAEDENLHDPQKTPPAVHDEQSFGGTAPALTSDDNVDELGKEYGVEYQPEEELDVTKKINPQTPPTPPKNK